MRVRPAVPVISRGATEAFEFEGLRIVAGTLLSKGQNIRILLCRKPQAAALKSRWDTRCTDSPSWTARYRLWAMSRSRVCLTCCQ
jgi:hypothetical protein